MSAQNIPCKNPTVCGVQTHRPGTISPCMTVSASPLGSSLPPASRLTQPVQTLSGTVQPRQDTVQPDRSRIAFRPERDPIIHLQTPEVKPQGLFGKLKSALFSAGASVINADSKVNDILVGRNAPLTSNTPVWDGVKYAVREAQENRQSKEAENIESGTDFLESSLNDERQGMDEYENKLRREERQARMEQAWDARRNEASAEPTTTWSEKLSKMEESWEQRRQSRGL